MIKEVHLSTMDDVMQLVSDQPKDSIGRYRGTYLYRGMVRTEFKLITSLQRNCGSKRKILEGKLLSNFRKYTSSELEIDTNNIWQLMILGQHYGLPTRLLDWTHSPLVALSFATLEPFTDIAEHDSAVWRIDYSSIHKTLPQRFKDELKTCNSNIFTVDMLSSVTDSLEKYDEFMGKDSMVIMEPPSLDPRIINQYAFFAVIPTGISNMGDYLEEHAEDTVKYIIDKKLKWHIRDFLDEVNISERTIYPGLDGISKWLARHYYVINDPER